jgi:hypothetical protein
MASKSNHDPSDINIIGLITYHFTLRALERISLASNCFNFLEEVSHNLAALEKESKLSLMGLIESLDFQVEAILKTFEITKLHLTHLQDTINVAQKILLEDREQLTSDDLISKFIDDRFELIKTEDENFKEQALILYSSMHSK